METHLEREYKFDVDPGFDPPDLRPVVGRTERLPQQRLTTTYYDTPDLALWEQGITLRFRVEVSGDGPPEDDRTGDRARAGKWTLKLPAMDAGAEAAGSEGSGDRWELTWKADGARVPDQAVAVVCGLVRNQTLQPVVVLQATRRRLLLQGAADRPWGEIDDDLVEVTSGARQGLRFRQMELELLGDAEPAEAAAAGTAGVADVADVAEVVDALRRAGAVPGGGSKFALAAGLDGSRPGLDGSRPGPADGGGSLRQVVGAILRADANRWLEADYRLRVPAGDGDPGRPDPAVVQLALGALRQWRAHLGAFEQGLDPVWSRHLRADLARLEELLEVLRIEDAVLQLVVDHADPDDADQAAELRGLLSADRHLGALDLVEELQSAPYQEALGRMAASRHAPPLIGVDPDGRAAPFLRAALATRWRRARRSARSSVAGTEATGAKRFGRLADTARACEPHLGRRAGRLASAAQEVSDALTDVVDARAAAHRLRETALHPAVTPAVAFVAGRVAGRAEAGASRRADGARRAATRLSRRHAAAWLD